MLGALPFPPLIPELGTHLLGLGFLCVPDEVPGPRVAVLDLKFAGQLILKPSDVELVKPQASGDRSPFRLIVKLLISPDEVHYTMALGGLDTGVEPAEIIDLRDLLIRVDQGSVDDLFLAAGMLVSSVRTFSTASLLFKMPS